MSLHAKKHAKKSVLKRSLLSHAVAVAAVAVGGFGQQAFAVDLCTAPPTTIGVLSPADSCLLDAAAEALTVSATGSLGDGVDVTAAAATISNAGLVADDWTAIDYDTIGLDGSLTNTGTVEVDSGNYWAAAVYVDDAAVAGTLNNNGGTINAAAFNGGGSAYADAINVGGEYTTTPTGDLNAAANITSYIHNNSDVALEGTGALINSGTVSASAEANGAWVAAFATGIEFGGAVLGDITNSGTVSAASDSNGTNNRSYNYAKSIRVDGGDINSVNNVSSNTTVGETYSTTFVYNDAQAFVGLGAAASLDNSGTISASANRDSGGPWGPADASALYIDGVVQGALVNSGTVIASADSAGYYAYATGIRLDGGDVDSQSGNGSSSTDSTGPNTSSNELDVWANSWAELSLDSTASLTNSGSLYAIAYADGYGADAQALYIDDAALAAITNSGTISAAAETGYGDDAYAQAVYIGDGSIGSNSGSEISSASAVVDVSSASNYTNTSADDQAYIALGAAANLTNSGTIAAAASADDTNASATALEISGAVLSDISNSGTISASAEAWDDAAAYGLLIGGGSIDSGSSRESGTSSATVATDSTASTSMYEHANAWSDIGLGSDASLTNTGTGTIIASVEMGGGYSYWSNGYATATALEVDGVVLGAISNSGIISASALSTDSYARVYATGASLGAGWVGSNSGSGSSSSSGSTTVVSTVTTEASASAATSANADDSAYIGLDLGASLTNSGSISASADASYSDYAYATALEISGAVLGAVNNSGTISAAAEADDSYVGAYGLTIGGGTVAGGGYGGSDSSSTTTTTTATPELTTVVEVGSGASANNYADDYAYTGLGLAASLTNSGSVSAVADAGYSSADAQALYIDGAILGTISNTGSITASADAYRSAYALGLSLDGGYTSSDSYSNNASYGGTSTENSSPTASPTLTTTESDGSITGANAYATEYADIGLGLAASLTNSGSISATADASGNSSYASATALEIDGAVLGAISNSGTISASAAVGNPDGGNRAYARGLSLYGGDVGSSSGSSTFSYGGSSDSSDSSVVPTLVTESSTSNYTWSSVDADDYARVGLGPVDGITNAGTITNSGSITAVADAGNYYADARAFYVDGAVQGAISNIGTISASAQAGGNNAYATGLLLDNGYISSANSSSDGSYGSTYTSSVTEILTTSASTWNNVSASTYADDYAYIGLDAAASLTNASGATISAMADAADDYADARALVIEGAVLGAVSNSGTISASAEAGSASSYGGGSAYAYGLRLEGGTIGSTIDNASGSDIGTSSTAAAITTTTTDTTYAYVSADDQAYIGLGSTAALTNSGTITASATVGESADDAAAIGLYVDGAVLGAISNSGSITASAEAGDDNAWVSGVTLDGGYINTYSESGSGSMSEGSSMVSVSTSQRMWATDDANVSLGSTGVFANSGSISASATVAGGSYYDLGYATATALEIDGAILGAVSNTGTISASVSGTADYSSVYAAGVSLSDGWLYTQNGTSVDGDSAYTYDGAYVGIDSTGSLTNDGTISAFAEAGYAYADASGLHGHGVLYGALTNNGEITATAIAANYGAYAYGVDLNGGRVESGNQDSSTVSYIGLGSTGTLTNTGIINAFAEAGSNNAYAYGVSTEDDMAGVITNSGTIRASADAGDDYAYAYGLSVYGDVSGTITNSNAIAANANAGDYYADARALYVDGDVSGVITNSDSLGAFAGAGYRADAQGLVVDGDVSGTVSSSGTIDVAADGGNGYAWAQGVVVWGGMNAAGSLSNTGQINVRAESNDDGAEAYGVRVFASMHDTASVSNASGAQINVQVDAQSSVSAYGIDLGVLLDSAQLVNAGSISVQAMAGTSDDDVAVYGVHTRGVYDAAQVVNSGTITVEQSGFGGAEVVGLATGSVHNSSTLVNSGAISVAAAGDVGNVSATGLSIGGAYDGASLTNSGTITVQTTGSSMFGGLFDDTLSADVQAVGISLDSQMVDSTLSNTGMINVTAMADSSEGMDSGTFGELFGSAFDFGGDASVYGIKAGLVDGASTISNSGSIMAEATGSDNEAYGIYVRALTNGAMVVNTGTIDVDAGSAGNAYGIFVDGGIGGMVSNSGTIGDGVYLRGNVGLTNTGSITNTASYVGGNYTQGVGGSLGFVVQDAADYGQIAVAGTADFTASNGVVVLLNPSDDLESGDVLADVVAAGTLTASAFDVSDNVLFWNFTPVIDGNTLDLTADYRGAAGVLANTGYNLSGSLAEVIDGIIDEGADGQYADLAAALNAAPDDAAAAALLAGFLPTLNGDVVDATRTATGGVSSSIDSRIAESRGAASGDAVKNGGVWLKTYFGMAEQDKVGNVNGFDVDSTGVVIGVDGDVTDAWRVGLAVGLSKAEVDAPLAQVDIDSNLFTLYGSYTVNDRTALDLTLGFGSNDYDSVRNAGTFGTASSTFDGDQLSFGANLSRTIKQGDKKVFIPSVSFQYLEVNVGGYSETGAGIMNNTVAAVDETSVSVLAKGTWEWTMANTGVFAAHLGLGFDSTDDAGATVTLAGNGPTYNVKGVDAEDVLLAAGLGYRYVTKKDLEIVVGYDLEAREDFQAGVAAVKFKMPF